MSRLSSSRSKVFSSLLALLSAASLTACPPVEFEGDPGAGGHQAAAGGSSKPGSGGGVSTGAGGASTAATGGSSQAAAGSTGVGGSSQAAAGSTGVGGSSFTSTVAAAFGSFRLRRTAGLGLCAQPSQAQDVQFARDVEGRLVLSGTRFHAPREQSGDACPEGTNPFASNGCISQLPTLRLTAEQTAALDQLVAALPAGQCVIDPGISCDSCLVTSVQIDSRSEYEGCCGEQRSLGFNEAFTAIKGFVDGLIRQPAIQLQRYAAFGQCITEGEGLKMALARGADGLIAMSGTYLAKSIASNEQCPVGTDSSVSDVACIGTLSSAKLTALETARLDQLLLEVPVGQCNANPGSLCDVCETEQLVWGARTETSYCCGTQEAPGFATAFPAAVSYIDQLIRMRNPYGN